MSYVDIKPICYECRNCTQVSDILVGRIDEGGGYEPAYICKKKMDMSEYTVSKECWNKNQCTRFD